MHGVLFFPVTPFDSRDRVERIVLEQHLSQALTFSPGAIFPACGTGEFHALDTGEHAQVVATTVAVTAGRVPVVAGVGGPLGHARTLAAEAERLGADALLVLPPYLVGAPQEGLIAYVLAVADATALPVIVYHRGLATFSTASIERLLADPRVIGVKDGVGDIAAAQGFTLAAARAGRDDVLFFNGLLTAELSQLAYRAIGVPLYSSASFAMAPEIASAFYSAYRDDDQRTLSTLLTGFYEPLVRLRERVPGYGVSLVKAGLRLRGLDVGMVRAPLVDPSDEHLRELRHLLDAGLELVR